MPDEENSPVLTTEKIDGIPLYLIPRAIADQIRKKGGAVFRILVTKKFHHRYTVRVETSDEAAQRTEEGPPCQEGDGHG
jgi:hypothetical protein